MLPGSDVDVAIIGAGAAGIGAARTLQAQGKSFALLEASHRIGGRGYTEELMPGVPFDLGCHWFHSASINPLVAFADEFGMAYTKEGFERGAFQNGLRATPAELQEWDAFFETQYAAMERALAANEDTSIYEVTDREHKYTSDFDYIMSIHCSLDVDVISVRDLLAYHDTDENWPIRDGYGTLLTRLGQDLPVNLNTAVTGIDWSGTPLIVKTAKGDIRASKVLVTVSTGILGAGDILFTPALPDWKLNAINALPLGNHNRIAIGFDRDVFGSDLPSGAIVHTNGAEPMSIRFNPFGFPCAVGLTGGRHADWLEKAGQAASIDLQSEKLKAVCGNDIMAHATAEIVTAWRGDPWVKGAYSVAQPGAAGERANLARAIDDRLFFAGEATSADFYSTAHGAYMSGIDAAEEFI